MAAGDERIGATDELPNRNTDWLYCRGIWFTNILIVLALLVLFSSFPGITREASWTLTNLTYNIVSTLFNWTILKLAIVYVLFLSLAAWNPV